MLCSSCMQSSFQRALMIACSCSFSFSCHLVYSGVVMFLETFWLLTKMLVISGLCALHCSVVAFCSTWLVVWTTDYPFGCCQLPATYPIFSVFQHCVAVHQAFLFRCLFYHAQGPQALQLNAIRFQTYLSTLPSVVYKDCNRLHSSHLPKVAYHNS